MTKRSKRGMATVRRRRGTRNSNLQVTMGFGTGNNNLQAGDMATARRRGGRVHNDQVTRVVTRKALPVTDGLKSVETERQYYWHWNTFKKWMSAKYFEEITDDSFLEFERETLERDIIDYLKHLKGRGLKRSSVNSSMASILRFCRVNDIWVNKERISLFVPEDKNMHQDREYKREEIQRLLKESDPRLRVVFLLLTNGLRIGAVNELNIGHLKPWPLPTEDEKPQKVYQLFVYAGTRSQYYTFLTPETATAIDDYLTFRKKNSHEDITRGTSPLIREQFPLYNKRLDAAIPKRMSKSSLQKTIQRVLKKAGLDNMSDDIMLTHGFRKFAVTMMKKAKIDWSDREFLIGHRHSRGLDVQYDKTSEEDRLVEWSKCINLLTIEKSSFHLQKELQIYKDEYAKKFVEQDRMLKEQAQMIEKLKDDYLDLYQDREATKNKIYDRDRRRMGYYDDPPKPIHVDISPEELAKVPPPPTQEERKRRLQR